MKHKVQWIFWSGLLCLLILLYLISSTDLVLSENVNRIYNLAVIMDESTEIGYTRYRLGMEEAMAEVNADVNFITLQKDGDDEEQRNLLRQEWDNGAEAVIIFPADPAGLQSWLQEQSRVKPVISIGAAIDAGAVKQSIKADRQMALRSLKEQLEAELAVGEQSIYILQNAAKQEASGELTKRLQEELAARRPQLLTYAEGELPALWERLSAKPTAIIATDRSSLEMAMALQKERQTEHRLYGFGMSDTIIAGLQRRECLGISGSHQYQMGYQAILSAVQAIRGEKVQQKELAFDDRWVRPQQIYEDETENMIFPIN